MIPDGSHNVYLRLHPMAPALGLQGKGPGAYNSALGIDGDLTPVTGIPIQGAGSHRSAVLEIDQT